MDQRSVFDGNWPSKGSRTASPDQQRIINQKLGYLVRCGDPDAIDSIVPMAYGTMALDLIMKGTHGRLVALRNGRYDHLPIDIVTSKKKLVNVSKHYDTERFRPIYEDFEMLPLFLMASE